MVTALLERTPGGRVSDNDANQASDATASSLTAAVLDEEAARQASQAERSADVIFADDLLPGVGSEEMPLREGLKKGGFFTFVVLLLLNSLDELEQAGLIKDAIRTGGMEQLEQIVEIVHDCGGLSYTVERAAEQTRLALDALAPVPASPYKDALHDLAEESLKRTY